MENGGVVGWDLHDPIDEEELDAAFSLAESLASSRKRPKSCITREDAANPIDEEELDAAFSLAESLASSRKCPKSCITREDAANPIDEEELDAAFSLPESIASSRKRPKSCITQEDACRLSHSRRLPEWGANGSHRMLRKLQSESQEREIGLFFRLLADVSFSDLTSGVCSGSATSVTIE
ncbi:hypothetical protein ACLOJK_011083 [Asimina triloba]